MKINLKLIAAVAVALLFIASFAQNLFLGAKIKRLEQQRTSSAMEERMRESEYRVLGYKNRIDSLFKVRSDIQTQIDEIRRQNAERMTILQAFDVRILNLKKQLDEKRNWNDSSVHAIDNILPR